MRLAGEIVRDTLLKEVKKALLNLHVDRGAPDRVNSVAARQLLMLTAAVESDFIYIGQRRGPAITVYQMEPASLADAWRWARRRRGWLQDSTPQLRHSEELNEFVLRNLYAATVMARIMYWRAPDPLPEAGDWPGLAQYWKKHWNTDSGRGTVARAIRAARHWDLYELGYGL